MSQPYRVMLTEDEQAQLHSLIGAGVAPARELTRARVLLKTDRSDSGPGWTDARIADALEIHAHTVARVRRQYVTEGLTATLERKRPDRVYPRCIDGEQEAHVIALVCGTPPEGHAQWSLRLLADEVVRLEIVEAVSHETVRQVLKKTR